MKKKVLIFSILLTLLITLFSFFYFRNKQPVLSAPTPTVQSDQIIAPSIIDGLSDLTRIPSWQSGIIKHIYVSVGQVVKKGDPLFSLESKLIKNSRKINQLSLEQTTHAITTQKKQLEHLKQQLARLKSLDKRAISQSELQDKNHEVKMATAQLRQAEYNLQLTTANLKQTELTLSQFTVKAPKDGVILQINAHPNEFVGQSQQIMYLGDAKNVIVRVSIDEREAYRFQPDAPAYLINYENAALNIPLTFIQLDQYIITQERLNSRVLEALYSFDRSKYPHVIAGQLFDAHITLRTPT